MYQNSYRLNNIIILGGVEWGFASQLRHRWAYLAVRNSKEGPKDDASRNGLALGCHSAQEVIASNTGSRNESSRVLDPTPFSTSQEPRGSACHRTRRLTESTGGRWRYQACKGQPITGRQKRKMDEKKKRGGGGLCFQGSGDTTVWIPNKEPALPSRRLRCTHRRQKCGCHPLPPQSGRSRSETRHPKLESVHTIRKWQNAVLASVLPSHQARQQETISVSHLPPPR